MALTQKLELRQSQALVMTPQLMQAIKLLQLSNLDLAAYVDAELERNPLLERLSDEGDAPSPEPSESEQAAAGDPGSADWLGEDLATSRTAIEDQLGTKLDNVFPDDAGALSPRVGSRRLARIRNGPAWGPAAATKSSTISRHS
jgi:RNA polymerase sigma-54 factor